MRRKSCALYRTRAKVCKDHIHDVGEAVTPDLWHKRLDHMREKGLQILAKKELISNVKG